MLPPTIEKTNLLEKFDTFVFDADGVLWTGDIPIPGAAEWINTLLDGGKTDGEKFRITLPLFYPLCAADLHGHLMWTVCDPLTTVEYEFGDKWYVDLPSKQYRWQSTPKNVKSAGWYSRWELRRVWFEDGYG
uniref:Uncharacterized protein n=1 Tax=Caenorhabditis japonica TaxID=281687 RepID=A0A8R1E4L2_CAEJA